MKKQVEVKITGKVQGVLFRHSAKAEAERMGLSGWVKNEEDGSVKIVAEGKEQDLQKFMEWARLGTEWAKVEKMEFEWREASGEFESFVIL